MDSYLWKNVFIAPFVRFFAAFGKHDFHHRYQKFRFYPVFPVIHFPKIAMTLLVKNEVDIISENILFHKAMGVDIIIVTDNGSTDGTLQILEKFLEQGIIQKLIQDFSTNYQQAAMVDRMIRLAIEKYSADWIINCDADEFFYCRKGDYHQLFSSWDHNAYLCDSYTIYSENPVVKNPITDCTLMVQKTLKDQSLGRYHIFRQKEKAIHRAQGYKMIHVGNHNVDMEITSQKFCPEILLYHYAYRGYEHFKQKVTNGAKVWKNEPEKLGPHWKYYAHIFDEQGEVGLKAAYRQCLGLDCKEKLLRKKYIKKDTTIQDFFQHKHLVSSK